MSTPEERAMQAKIAAPDPVGAEAEESWVVCAEWVDSSPTFHGPFAGSEEAERWARERLPRPGEGGCVGWCVGLLTPPER